MPFDSSDSRRAAAFDTFRRELVLHSRTVSGEAREAWFTRLKELVAALFPDAEVKERKPGLATRLYSIEVAMPGRDKQHLLDLAQELDDNWQAQVKEEVRAGASCVYLDRLDAVWEWAVDTGNAYVTGHVKLRNYPFDQPAGDRPERAPREFHAGRGRPSYGDRDRHSGPPKRNFGGGGGYGKPPGRGRGPSRPDGGPRPYKKRYND